MVLAETRRMNFLHCFCWLFSLLIVSTAAAAPIRLTFETQLQPQFAISPDGSQLVYRAANLMSVPLTGGPSVQLNPPLVAGGLVTPHFRISPDSRRVVYMAEQDTDFITELYSVPIAGGQSIKLNRPMAVGRTVIANFQISPDSKRVVHIGPASQPYLDLFSTPIEGGEITMLSSVGPDYSLSATATDPSFSISPDSSQVVWYQSPRSVDSPQPANVFVAPVEGGVSRQLNPPLADLENAFNPLISPDGSRVQYVLDKRLELRGHTVSSDLFSVPLAGGEATLPVAAVEFGIRRSPPIRR